MLQIGPRRRRAENLVSWNIEWQRSSADASASQAVVTEHVFMSWDDIIRSHWQRRPWRLWPELLRTYFSAASAPVMAHAWRTHRPVFASMILPGTFVLLALLIATLAGWAAGAALGTLLPAGLDWLATLAGLALALATIYGASLLGERLKVFWLLRICAFNMRYGQGPIDALERRQREWVEQVVTMQQRNPVDEVLLVGHSVGTLVMVPTVDALLADPRWQAATAGRHTNMLTLGQCYPFVSLAPAAQSFRAALQRLCGRADLRWWDVTARIDPLCFFLSHPLAGSEDGSGIATCPLRHGARFFPMYEPANWERMRRDKLLTHFLYLMTPDRAGNFNGCEVLYGPRPFEQHLASQS